MTCLAPERFIGCLLSLYFLHYQLCTQHGVVCVKCVRLAIFVAGILLHFSMLTMSAAADQLNNDEHQYKKTKEMVIGPLIRNPPTQITIGDRTVDRVLQFTLLGVTINEVLKWNDHTVNVLDNQQACVLSEATEASRHVNE